MTNQLHISMNRKTFQSKLEDKFSLDEIRTICSYMGIKYENLGGINTLKSRVRELILLCEREQRLLELIFYITEERPKAQWYKLEE